MNKCATFHKDSPSDKKVKLSLTSAIELSETAVFCVQLCIETLCKWATSVAHLTNLSFEFFYEIFTEDASPLPLYHGAKKSKMTKNSNQGGPALKQRMYIASRTSRWCFDRQRDKTVKSESRKDLQQSAFTARWHATADWYPCAGFSRFFGGLPGRFRCGSRTASRMCFGTCCEMRSTNLWAVFPTNRLPH